MTPREVRRRYSNGRVLLIVCRKGYRNRGMCAENCGEKLFYTHLENILLEVRFYMTNQKEMQIWFLGGKQHTA